MSVTQVQTPGYTNTSVTSEKLANDAVTTTKIANGNVTPAKLSTGGPSWNAEGNLSATAFSGPLTGNVTGNVTGNLTGNADTATKFSTTSGSAPAYAVRAWVTWGSPSYSGGVSYIVGQNISSVSSFFYNGQSPAYSVVFSTAMPDANFAVAGICNDWNYSPKLVELGRGSNYVYVGAGPYSGSYIFTTRNSLIITR